MRGLFRKIRANCRYHGRCVVRRVLAFVLKHIWPILGLCTLVGVSASVWALINYREWLGAEPFGRESYSTTFRNVGLVVGGVLALLLAFWRSIIADLQVKTAQRDLLEQRYQKGLEMLGGPNQSERLGGIYELQRLAHEHPNQYHVPVIRRFCAFVRNPAVYADGTPDSDVRHEPPHETSPVREDFQAIMDAIGSRVKTHLDLEAGSKFQLNLKGSDLSGIQLTGANLTSRPWWEWKTFSRMEFFNFRGEGDLSYTKFCSARLDSGELANTNLSGACMCKAWLIGTDLSGADLTNANLHGALFAGTNLSGTRFSFKGSSPAQGITQSDLDLCRADPKNPPDLSGVRDFDTGEPLVWSGKPIDD